MRKRLVHLVGSIAVLSLSGAALGQPATSPKTLPPTPSDGLWPSPKQIELLLTRRATDLGDRFELDDDQATAAQAAIVDRWGSFLKKNEETIKPLFNEFVEMKLQLSRPETDRVRSWAERAMPMLDAVRAEFDRGAQEFSEILTPAQRIRFKAELLATGVGFGFAEQKLRLWQTGEYDDLEIWNPPRRRKRELEAQKREAKEAEEKAAAIAADRIAEELDEWRKYVATFATAHDLDEGQRDAANSCLAELSQRGRDHRDLHHEQIRSLERRIASSTGSTAELAALKNDLAKLYGPIDDLFRELKNRVEQIPTTAQRAAADIKSTEAP